jgi:hypothetical protein
LNEAHARLAAILLHVILATRQTSSSVRRPEHRVKRVCVWQSMSWSCIRFVRHLYSISCTN